jgi:hypothetical protein
VDVRHASRIFSKTAVDAILSRHNPQNEIHYVRRALL